MCQAYLRELQIVIKNFVSYLRAVLFVTIILVTTAKDDFWWLATKNRLYLQDNFIGNVKDDISLVDNQGGILSWQW